MAGVRWCYFPVAYLFIVGQALGSFELRSRMSMYRSLALSVLTVIIASEAAVSLSYLLCLAIFVLLVIAAMATANLEDQSRGATRVRCGRRFSPVLFWAGSALFFLLLSGLLFWTFPRISIMSQSFPGYLPSHMEVVSDLPPALPTEPSAPTSVLPRENEDDTRIADQLQPVEQEGDNASQIEGQASMQAIDSGEAAESGADGQEIASQPRAEEGESHVELAETQPVNNESKTYGAAAEMDSLGWPNSGDAVVMNVRSPVASYWRGMVLDRYDGIGWSLSPNRPALEIETVESEGKAEYLQTYYVQTDVPSPLFVGYVPLAVALPETGVRVIRKEGEPARFQFSGNLPYRTLSQIPDFDPGELRRDVAGHRDLAYLGLPPVPARVLALAEEVVSKAATDFDKAVRLEKFLQQNFDYGNVPRSLSSGAESTDSFLFQRQTGNCSEFASAMTVMARLVGLPARVAIGYRPGTYDLWSGTYTVRAGDAHAWVEIHFRDNGWVPFDPTPSSQEQLWTSPLLRWDGLARWQHYQFGLSISSPGAAALNKLVTLGGWNKTIVWSLVILPLMLVLAFGGVLVRRRFYRSSKPGGESFKYSRLRGSERRRMLKLFEKLEAVLTRGGFRRHWPSETLAEYARAAGSLLPRCQENIKWLTEVTSRAAYDPKPLSDDMIDEAAQKVGSIAGQSARGQIKSN
ncbi:DUF3488 and DUF4129 domain-containing transglutaminase family protein [Chloroflexota bacterium]